MKNTKKSLLNNGEFISTHAKIIENRGGSMKVSTEKKIVIQLNTSLMLNEINPHSNGFQEF
jgi:hypothetical protein